MISWREELVIARERQAHGAKPFTPEVVDRACVSWMTCAIGEQHRLHPEVVKFWNSLPLPLDITLCRLGSSDPPPDEEAEIAGFGYAVETQDVDAAERALDAIEDYVLVLKRGF
jgi:hypothetical protein